MPEPARLPYEYIPIPAKLRVDYLLNLEKIAGARGRLAGKKALQQYDSGQIGTLWAEIERILPKYTGVGTLPTEGDLTICFGVCSGLLLPEIDRLYYAGCVLACLYRKLRKRRKKRRL